MHQGLLQVKGAVEAVGFQNVANAAVEPLYHPIGLGRLRRCQAVLNAELGAKLVELVLAGRGPCA